MFALVQDVTHAMAQAQPIVLHVNQADMRKHVEMVPKFVSVKRDMRN
jgi:hypothetical protein